MDGLLNKVLGIIIVGSAFFLLAPTILIPFFNASYSATVTGLSSTTLQGLMLFVFFILIIAVILGFIKSGTGKF
jgi:hypothetical protein